MERQYGQKNRMLEKKIKGNARNKSIVIKTKTIPKGSSIDLTHRKEEIVSVKISLQKCSN